MTNHPRPEEWVPYLYGEVEPELRRQLRAHLNDCAECQNQLKEWRDTRQQLNRFRLPHARAGGTSPVLALKWAFAAALIVLVAGFGLGRWTARPDIEKIRAAIEPELKQALKREIAQVAGEQIEQAKSATLAAASEEADEIAAAYTTELYFLLKQDVDTVALNTDAGLRQTEEQIVQLADAKALPEEETEH